MTLESLQTTETFHPTAHYVQDLRNITVKT